MQLISPLLNDDSPTEKIAPPVTPPLPTSAADKIPSIIDDADYQLIRSKRKTLAVSVLDGKVTVRAPFRMPNYLITIFLQEKSEIKESSSDFTFLDGLIYPTHEMQLNKYNVPTSKQWWQQFSIH